VLGGELHEQILDDLMMVLQDQALCNQGVGCFREASIFNIVHRTQGCGLVADAYFMLPDDAYVVMVEVGDMRDGKWGKWTAPDYGPVRVLRVGKDRSSWLLNPRGSDVETRFMETVRRVLLRT